LFQENKPSIDLTGCQQRCRITGKNQSQRAASTGKKGSRKKNDYYFCVPCWCASYYFLPKNPLALYLNGFINSVFHAVLSWTFFLFPDDIYRYLARHGCAATHPRR